MRLLHLLTLASTTLATTLPLTRRTPTSSTTSPLKATEYGTIFDVPVTIGNQTFQLLVDTGSSDTYVVQTGFTCIDEDTNSTIPQAECLYSNHTYNPDYSDTYRRVEDQYFGIKYGAGIASGDLAYETVSLGGLTVKNQKVGIAHRTNPMGDGVNSGLLGLAYPSITSAHPGNASSSDNSTYFFNRKVYNPLLYNMHQQGVLKEPYFSLALASTPQNESTTFGGYLSLGELPPVKHSDQWATVPVEIYRTIPVEFTSGNRTRFWWTTTVQSVRYGSKSANKDNSTAFQTFVDSGNNFSYLPAAVVDSVNALFDPPARFDDSSKLYVVDCNAKAPVFGLQLGNQTFYHNPADLIQKVDNDLCVSSLAASEDARVGDITVSILGVSFLKSVVAVFDFGKDEMRFAKRLN
ncbi:hypothetical protein SI65_03700 [Aspergillus cristatus]|uniref:Peptidase A1 domain-containing protein n=1 Tax=Aspergillus cristatus TaxID=573508 RepID=A0A1E3BIA5_ASPCR|nr:hypothetical protein SI65_03700 [Aspergillus cristatus]